jgi:Flp pilus assembly protein TadG
VRTSSRHRDRLGRSAGLDAGSSAIELVLVTPVLIALIFSVVQAALLWHSQHVVVAAAQQGDRFARTVAAAGADDAQVRAATLSYLHSLGADLVDAPTVTVDRAGGWATVTVTAHAVSLLPGATLTVHGTSHGPIEVFTADGTGGGG